ncbi:MAG: hypothetical protein JWP33_2205 [Blastococcus sp.]|nr:hypothetical protein [Blastococcus sp.]
MSALLLTDTPDVPALAAAPRVGPAPSAAPARRPSRLHVHWFRRSDADPFSSATLYACRCGQGRSGF